MSAKGKKGKKVPAGRVSLDSELYRAITLKAYSQQTSVSETINEMLKPAVGGAVH